MAKTNKSTISLLRILISTFLGLLFLCAGVVLCTKYFMGNYHYAEDVVISEAERVKDKNVRKTELVVTSSTTLDNIASRLCQDGIITDAKFFKTEAKLDKITDGFIPGTYTISSNMTSNQILSLLTTSTEEEDTTLKFTIPEGYTIDQIAESLAAKGIVTKSDFIKAVTEKDYASEYPFIQDIPDQDAYKYKLEGYLFPDTYIVRKDASAEEIVLKMLDRFGEIYDKYEAFSYSTGYSTHELITIASIIEQEARLDEERPIISGVIYNRLANGMRLQMCSTVQYSLNKRKANLTYEDLEKDSPYNTYLYDGLPIGPICCPGEACIKAAVLPDDNDYFFFVLKDPETGSHSFTQTIEEHNAEKALYRQSDDINFTE